MTAAGSRLSAGVVVVRDSPDGVRFLLLRAYRNWDFPKGHVEAGEEPLAAAIRETQEESEIADLEFVWGYEYVDTGPYNQGKISRYYVAQTRVESVGLPINPMLGRPEHHEYRWVDLTEALALVSPRVQPVVTWAAGKVMSAGKFAAPAP